jgi:hypothetical protein
MLSLTIGAPPNGLKKIHKGWKVGRMYGVMSELKNKPLTKSLVHSFKRNGGKQPENRIFMLFFTILGPYGHP